MERNAIGKDMEASAEDVTVRIRRIIPKAASPQKPRYRLSALDPFSNTQPLFAGA